MSTVQPRSRVIKSSSDPKVYLRQIWYNMKCRCLDESHESFPFYGGANPPVKIHEPWLVFENFYHDVLAEIGPRPSGVRNNGLSLWELDRKDSYSGYRPTNIRWLRWDLNQGNKRKRSAAPHSRKEKQPKLPPYISNSSTGILTLNSSNYY